MIASFVLNKLWGPSGCELLTAGLVVWRSYLLATTPLDGHLIGHLISVLSTPSPLSHHIYSSSTLATQLSHHIFHVCCSSNTTST